MDIELKKDIYEEIRGLLKSARENIVSTINSTMAKTYFLIGKRILKRSKTERKELNMEKS